jgi:hypothetical protein
MICFFDKHTYQINKKHPQPKEPRVFTNHNPLNPIKNYKNLNQSKSLAAQN